MQYKIAVISGDGIGPEIMKQGLKVVKKIGDKYGHSFKFREALMGGAAIDTVGVPLPEETIKICLDCDSVLLSAVGGEKWDFLPGDLRPEAGLLEIRSKLGLYANIRPASLFEPLKKACPLRGDILEKGIDMVVVRDLTGGIYFGERGRQGDRAFDTEQCSKDEVRRIGEVAFETAKLRRNRVTSIDKANVLETSRLWRETMEELSNEHPEVELVNMLVDNASMQLIRNPSQFDVIVAGNMFGDILSDEAGMITGSIGLLPSASLGETSLGLYEPVHGSAPNIAGKDKANPIAMILSCAMMFEHSFGLNEEARAIENAINLVLEKGIRTVDIKDDTTTKLVGTNEMGDLITALI